MMIQLSKYKVVVLLGLAVGVSVAGASAARADDLMYVQAVKAGLMSEPKMGGVKVEELKRGEELTVVEKKDLWFHVRHGAKDGWASKLFLTDHKPVGSAELSQSVDVSLEKASRRRSSSYAVSATTRGLSADERVRGGRALYNSDFEALKEMESYSLSKEDLALFRNSAKLGD